MNQKVGWALFSCTITHVFVHVYTMMHIAILPVFIAEFHLSIFESGLLVSLPLLISILFSFPYGFIADKIGPRKLIALSLTMSGLAGIALTSALDFYALLVPLTFIQLSSTIYHPPALTVVSEVVSKNRRSSVLGIHGAGGTAGVALGPITLGLTMVSLGWRLAYLIWAVPILVSNIFLIKLPETRFLASSIQGDQESPLKNDEKETSWESLYAYLVLLIATTVHGLGAQSVGTYMTTYLVSNRGLGEDLASLLHGLNSAVGIIGSLGGGYLAVFSGNKKWLIIAYGLSLFIYMGIWLGPLWTLIIIYLAGGYLGASTMGPSMALAAEFSPKGRRGLAFNFFMLSANIMGAVAPIIAAKIIEQFNIEALFPFALAISIISIVCLLLLPREKLAS